MLTKVQNNFDIPLAIQNSFVPEIPLFWESSFLKRNFHENLCKQNLLAEHKKLNPIPLKKQPKAPPGDDIDTCTCTILTLQTIFEFYF